MGLFIPLSCECFEEVIRTYTLASSSKLNIEKFVIIPFSSKPLREWIHASGCRILGPKDVHKYLGVPFGYNIEPGQLHNFVIEKVTTRINSWSAKLLSFSSRVMLIKHILQAIPIYHLMILPILSKMAKTIAGLLNDFLWGFNPSGGRKTTLVAWKRICVCKSSGGLSIKHIPAHSKALLGKWIIALLNNPDLEWSTLFYANLKKVTWQNGLETRRANYTLGDRILLSFATSFHKLSYTVGLW